MILNLDKITGCLPPGFHKPTFNEFVDKFVRDFPDSETRENILIEYQNHCRELISLQIAEKQWIDGSYITIEENPDDIDFLTQFNGIEMDKKNITKKDVEDLTVDAPIEKDGGLCHSFPVVWYPEENEELHQDYRNTKGRYLASLWGFDENYNLKGIIEFDIDCIEGALVE